MLHSSGVLCWFGVFLVATTLVAKLARVGATQDVLHIGRVDGFCLVSSDSDFTRLATRIREAGLVVYGFGERKTPEPFVAACDKFIYTEILRTEPEQA